jgi:hypothetical protein
MFAAILLASAVSLGLPCPPLTPQNVWFVWASDDATCTFNSPIACTAGVPVQFRPVTFGYSFDCSTHTFAWDFGDGFKDSSRNAMHAFSSPGSYAVTLTIGSPSSETVVIKESVLVGPHPVPRRRAARH